ncbi:M16 family metallopeptidase [Pseudooceanicola algae]|uniref:Putative zinc protease n=1 Tax=Pseudooceanicola algae TaxID=1537215 RepID=A0A418SGC8_9RHOB|nr:pitrilysin family protein [Pseudooceanicola algae]QPM91648.1 putative zinc protease [Pseudooceanicola algae]
MLRRLAAGALTLAIMSTALAAPALSQETTSDLVTDFTLDNGLQVVVIEDHRAPVVVQMVWYRAGSADEQPGVSGIAHFLEHLMFKATDTLETGEFSAVVAENGGTDNAFTSFDTTAYHQRVAADRLPIMMQMEADRMVNLNLTEDVIATERDVILEERNMRIDSDPGALFQEQMRAAQYLNHHYGIPVIGWRHEMEELDLDDAEAFYKTYYAPNNATLIVAGDVTPEGVRALAEEYYGPIPANPDLPDRIRPQEPPQLAERLLRFSDPRIAQPYVTRTYLAPERDSGAQEEAAALVMLSQLLGGGQTGYLTEKLVLEQKIAVYTSAYYSATSLDDTVFGTYVVPAPGTSLEEAEAAMDAALASFVEEGVDEEDLDRIKLQIRAQDIYDRDDVAGLARMYGTALTRGLTIEDIQAWPGILQEVTPDQIIAAAQEVLNRDRAVTGYVMSEETQQ